MNPSPDSSRSTGKDWLQAVVSHTNRLLEERLTTDPASCPPRLQEAMRYACLGAGKRIRPALVCATAQAAARRSDIPQEPAVWSAAIAIEMLHAFTLVHDDLPAMDDDDLRRGQPTVHKAFDEATAILAGDALTVRAFELLADPAIPPSISAALVREIATGIGWAGVMAGQMLDLAAEGQHPAQSLVQNIHRLKTAALLRTSCRCGAMAVAAGSADVDRYGRFGEMLGLAFQAIDDLMDEVADEKQLGKRVRKDRELGKATLPAALGVAETRALAEGYIQKARDCLQDDGPPADALRGLARVLQGRLGATML